MREQQRGIGLPQAHEMASYWSAGDMDDLFRLFLSGRRDGLVPSRQDAGPVAATAAVVYPRQDAMGKVKPSPSREPSGHNILSLIGKPISHWLQERRVRRKINYYLSLPETVLLDIGMVKGQIEFIVRQEEMRRAEARQRAGHQR
jgi:hypothetical protein